MKIRRLEAHEGALNRQVRLRALRDSPDSFEETAADAEARPESWWDARTRSVTGSGPNAMFLACDGDEVVGCAYGLRDPGNDAAGRVGGMWVAPQRRREGIGRALLEAVLVWARGQGLSELRLWAPSESAAARALYRRAGFVETGRRRPLRPGAEQEIVELTQNDLAPALACGRGDSRGGPAG